MIIEQKKVKIKGNESSHKKYQKNSHSEGGNKSSKEKTFKMSKLQTSKIISKTDFSRTKCTWMISYISKIFKPKSTYK